MITQRGNLRPQFCNEWHQKYLRLVSSNMELKREGEVVLPFIRTNVCTYIGFKLYNITGAHS